MALSMVKVRNRIIESDLKLNEINPVTNKLIHSILFQHFYLTWNSLNSHGKDGNVRLIKKLFRTGKLIFG